MKKLLAPSMYKRVLLKISGECLGGNQNNGYDSQVIDKLTNQIIAIYNKGIEVVIVVGGGNLLRGDNEILSPIDNVVADQIGMLSTVMNGLFLQGVLEKKNIKTRLMTSIDIRDVAEPYIRRRAIRHLEKGRLVIFAAGIGNPYFSTDTAAVLRAKEVSAAVVIKGTKVDGVYNKDPVVYKDATKYESLTYSEVIQRNLRIMDMTAITFSSDNGIPIYVLDITDEHSLIDFFEGKRRGTQIG